VSPYAVTLTVDDFSGTYGTQAPLGITTTLSNPAVSGWTEADLPYGETKESIFGTLTYNITELCDIPADNLISVAPEPALTNYQVTYVDGTLSVTNQPLTVTVLDAYVNEGAALTGIFSVTSEGLVCEDQLPALNFVITNADGNIVTPPLAAGDYDVSIAEDISSLPGFEYYDVTQVPGRLIINPSVGCNDRLQASDVCKVDNVTLTDYTWVTTLVKFTVFNSLDVPVYLKYDTRANQFKGNAQFIFASGSPTEIFVPGETVIEVYTDGGGLQLELITPGCNSASKSANGSNANPCPVNLEAGMDLDAQVLGIEEVQSMAYPNPAIDYLNLFVGDQEGQIDVQVFDTSGRMLISRDYGVTGLQEVQLDISALNPGFYFVKVGSAPPIQIIKQ
jgi:hypothetical protein